MGGRFQLRVALLTAMEPADPARPEPRAFLRVGGTNLVRHQLGLVLSAGVERVVCVAREPAPELAVLQREAEQASVRFHVVAGAQGLAGLVTAADEVLVVAEGLLPTTGDALRLIEMGAGVLVQPAEDGIPAGFERIDLNHAAGGVMLIPGRLVDRLNELPPDADPSSALLRIALQAGIQQRSVPDEVIRGGRWLLVRNEAEAQAAEASWMSRHTAGVEGTPGPLLARILVRQFGPALLHGGNGTGVVAITATVLALLGLGLCWSKHVAVGLLFAGAGWVLRRAAAMLGRVQRESLSLRRPFPMREFLFDVIFDTIIVAMLVIAIPPLPGETLGARCFAPLVLLGLLRLLPRGFPGRWSAWADDRLVLTIILVVLDLGNVLDLGLPALSVLLIVGGLVLPRDAERLTRA